MEVKIMKNILAASDQMAVETRKLFSKNNVFAVNMMSSPGSGKTEILEKTIDSIKEKVKTGVIEGDITSSFDARRLLKFDIPVIQINTKPFGGDCHLEASWIRESALEMDLKNIELLVIENIGNLVCPAEFDTGSHKNITVISVTEGEDKPLKYPLMFHKSHLVLINKCDLIDVLNFEIELLEENIKKVNPKAEIIRVSARTGKGMDKWVRWLGDNLSDFKKENNIHKEER
ncbi:MAG: hydrogenase nickel incorporation protein HypB [Elusimicrobiota bacterium]